MRKMTSGTMSFATSSMTATPRYTCCCVPVSELSSVPASVTPTMPAMTAVPMMRPPCPSRPCPIAYSSSSTAAGTVTEPTSSSVGKNRTFWVSSMVRIFSDERVLDERWIARRNGRAPSEAS
jgi:hypothetical protein